MFSLQRILGRPKKFFGLLEESAALGSNSVRALRTLLAHHNGSSPDLAAFAAARRRDKEVIGKLEEMLTRVFVTPIDREDIEAVAGQLYRLPKLVEKFAERYSIVSDRLAGVDFTPVADMLENAAQIVCEMVRNLSAGNNLAENKALDARLSQIEADAGRVVMRVYQRLYEPGGDPLTEIITRDLYGLLSDCVEVCSSAGRTMTLVILKNS